MKRLNELTWLTALLCALFCALLAACVPHPQSLSTDAAPATATVTVMATTTMTKKTATPTTPPTNIPEERDAEERDQESDDGYVHITPSQLALMLEDKDFLLVNTHTPYGYEIEHTDAHIPLDDEGQWLRHYPADRAAKIVLYCRSGTRSVTAAEELAAAGYTNLYHLDGGMVAWHADGLPLQNN
jgi:phage shock protein E